MSTLSTPVIIAIASIAIVAIVFVVVKMKPQPACPTCAACATAPPCPTCAACPTAPPCPTCATCPTCPPVPITGTWNIMIPDRDSKIPMKLSIKPGPSLLTMSTDDPNRRGQPPSEITKRLPADGGGELIYAAEPNRDGQDRPVVLFRNGKIYLIVEGVILSPASSNTNPSEYIGDWLLQRDSTIVGTFTMKRIENGDYVLSAQNRDIMTYTKKADGSALVPSKPDPRIGMAEFIYDKTLNKGMMVVSVN